MSAANGSGTGSTTNIDALFAQTLTGAYDDDAPWEAVRRLHEIGSREVFEKAANWCGSGDARQRARGADVLAQLGKTAEHPTTAFADESFMVLVGLALNEKAPQPLSSAIYALGHLADARAVPLVAHYSSHADARVRMAVAYACGCTPDEIASMETMLELMRDDDPDVRDWATFGLGTLSDLDSGEIREQLAAALNDPFEDVRLEALAGLAKRRDARCLPLLIESLEQPEVDEAILEDASMMLGLADPPEEWKPADYLAALRRQCS